MAGLEFKRQVRLPEEFFLTSHTIERRPWPRWPLAAIAWCGFSALCFGIATERITPGAWLEQALAEPQPASALVPNPRTPSGSPRRSPGLPAPTPEPASAAAALPAEPSDTQDRTELEQADDPGTLDQLSPDATAQPSAGEQELAAAPLGQLSPTDPRAEPTSQPQTGAPSAADPGSERSSAIEPSREPASQSSLGTSCEAAVSSYEEEVRVGGPKAPPDLSRAQYAALLENGSYFSHCGVPDEMSVDICVAVRNGKAVGITVRTAPGSRSVQSCVGAAVRRLPFPSHPRMDITRTRFTAL